MSAERRLAKAHLIANRGGLLDVGEGVWIVPSQSKAKGGYMVNTAQGTCTCADFEDWGADCKHILAVRLFQSLQHHVQPHASTDIMRPSYPQDWPAYNEAQTKEKEYFHILLRDLCAGVVSPPQNRGRPRLGLGDVVHAATTKVYTTMSGRRASTDVRECQKNGFIDDAPHHNSISHYLTMPALTPVLTALVRETALPLVSVESQFAIDSTGFGTSVYDRWYGHDYGEERRKRWLKAHAMVGTITNVVTAIRVTMGSVGDSTQLAGLVASTAENFDMHEVSADKGYLSEPNLVAIEAHGAAPFIPFKKNAVSNLPRTETWRKLWHLFWYKRDEFLKHYHRRSNVEATFGMIKKKFGGSLRSKKFQSQVNEVLCKFLCHNIVVLIHEMHELGIHPEFWQPSEGGRVLH
ncbi:MAG: transposase [Polyangiaceae bacterium]|nr:transposase [Polyangiaceae bacterium]